MCRACDGAFPTAQEHKEFAASAAELRRRMRGRADHAQFLNEISALDRQRFGGQSPEWGHAKTRDVTNELIFRRERPHALTLFVMTCWYDMQDPYTRVWTKHLKKLSSWIDAGTQQEDGLKFGRYSKEKAPHAWTTWQQCRTAGFESWFVKTVNRIAQKNSTGTGNYRKFVGALILNLMKPGPGSREVVVKSLARGAYDCVMQKRAWMLAMFLRRDQGIIKCLIERSVGNIQEGPKALERWYDGRTFPEPESELPIDKRIKELGRELFDDARMTEDQIADAAHNWGFMHQRAPSVLDALFFSLD